MCVYVFIVFKNSFVSFFECDGFIRVVVRFDERVASVFLRC